MESTMKTAGTLTMIAMMLGSCISMEPTAQVRDDVYFLPSQATYPPPAPEPRLSESTSEPMAEPQDDYYDPGVAGNMPATRDFYDITYNDPHYYNQGRFGFGMGGGMGMGMGMGMMGWQSGWSGPGWGMGMGWGSPGWNSGWGMNMGWGSGMGMGMGGNNPWMWNRPWGWHNPYMYDPWGWNSPFGWNSMGMGGWGPYMGPWGNCFQCYAPVVLGGQSNTIVGHRPSLSGGGGGGTTQPPPGGNRAMPVRNPASLMPAVQGVIAPQRPRLEGRPSPPAPHQRPGVDRDRPGTRPEMRPGTRPDMRPGNTPERQRPNTRPGTRPERTTPSPSRDSRPSFDRGGGMPSRSGGGGGGGMRPSGMPRPR